MTGKFSRVSLAELPFLDGNVRFGMTVTPVPKSREEQLGTCPTVQRGTA